MLSRMPWRRRTEWATRLILTSTLTTILTTSPTTGHARRRPHTVISVSGEASGSHPKPPCRDSVPRHHLNPRRPYQLCSGMIYGSAARFPLFCWTNSQHSLLVEPSPVSTLPRPIPYRYGGRIQGDESAVLSVLRPSMRSGGQAAETQFLAQRLELTPAYAVPLEIAQVGADRHVQPESGQLAVEQCVVEFL